MSDYLPSVARVRRDFAHYLDKATEHVIIPSEPDLERLFYLRPSSFPYCGLRFFLDFPRRIDDPRLNQLPSAYFTQVGTATHDVFQAYTAPLGRMVGDYKCPKCGNIERFTTFKVCKCGGHPKYLELELKYKDTVVGHTDNLYRLSPPAGKKSLHAVIDYKTTSTRRVKEDIEKEQKGNKRIFPYRTNVAQIETYVPLLEDQYGIKVDYWILVYLARDAPFRFGRQIVVVHLTDRIKAKIRKRLDRTVKIHRKVLKASSLDDTELIKKYKLCKDEKDYKANWTDEYNQCPHAGYCFAKKELDAKLKDTIMKNKVFPIIEQAPSKIRKGLKL